MHYTPSGGWIELVCGSMFSGKTEELLRRIRRAEIARKKVQLFKPTVDNRYGIVRVASHDGIGREDAIVVCDAEDILRRLEPDTEVVAVDEIQFFDEAIADVCDHLADRGLRIIAAGHPETYSRTGCNGSDWCQGALRWAAVDDSASPLPITQNAAAVSGLIDSLGREPNIHAFTQPARIPGNIKR